MTPTPRLVPDRPSDAAIVAEFWKRWTSATIHLEAAHELQRIHDDAKAADAAAPTALAHPSRAEPVAEVAMWSDGRGHAITPQEKTRSCAGDVAGYTIPLFAHPSRGVVDEELQARELLAAEYERAGFAGAADDARSNEPSPHCAVTLRAIRAALQAAALPAAGTVDGEALARRFHETYERLAPSFGYETRLETRAFDPASANGRLMIAVCSELAALPAVPEGLTNVEAVYAFAAWLTCRPGVLMVGETCNAAAMAQVVKGFCDEQGFPAPRDDYHTRIKVAAAPAQGDRHE